MNKKMTKCKTCGAEIAKSAKTCPQCGAKQTNKPLLVVGSVLLIAALLCVVVALSSVFPSKPSPTSQPNGAGATTPSGEMPIEISAQDLYQAYVDNEVNADNLYKGKLLAVTGSISDISTDIITDAPCVALESGDSLGLHTIQCFFSDTDDENAKVAQLSDGQAVTIIGKCSGTLVGNVQLSKCHLSE